MSEHAPIGHNADGIAGDRLKSIVDRVEHMDQERKALSSDITDVFKEAAGAGFNTKVLRTIIRLRKMDSAERDEMETLQDLYERALSA
jgi:uncharacterized protein (UPF0335 family)